MLLGLYKAINPIKFIDIILSMKTEKNEKVIDIILSEFNDNYNYIVTKLYASDFEVPQLLL